MKELFISSQYPTSGDSNNFNTEIPQYINEIKILEVSIPISFDNIPAGSFKVTGAVSGETTIVVSGGRYTQSLMATLVQNSINMQKSGQTYTVTQNLNNSFSFSSTTENFSLDFTGSALAPYIGFTGVTSQAAVHSGTSSLSYFNPSHIFICSSNVRGIDNGIIFNQQSEGILHAVPICSSGITKYRSDENSPWVKLIYLLSPQFMEQQNYLNLSLKLSTGLAVNMNGENWSIKLLVR